MFCLVSAPPVLVCVRPFNRLVFVDGIPLCGSFASAVLAVTLGVSFGFCVALWTKLNHFAMNAVRACRISSDTEKPVSFEIARSRSSIWTGRYVL